MIYLELTILMNHIYKVDMTNTCNDITIKELFDIYKIKEYNYCNYKFYNMDLKNNNKLLYSFSSIESYSNLKKNVKSVINENFFLVIVVPQIGN